MQLKEPEKAKIEFMSIVTDTAGGTTFTVPFNPSELKFSAETAKGEDGGALKSRATELGMQLIFDRSLAQSDLVQPDVERFLNAAHDPMKRRVIFQWNDIGFDGVVANVDVMYEMFRENGAPLRAKVDLTLSARESSVTMEEWSRDYKKLFGF